MKITKPSENTFDQLFKLIKYYSDRFEMLPKTMDELYHQMRGFRLLVDDRNRVMGCAHLDIFTPTLAEVKSLAVDPEMQGRGYGRILVEDCEREARELGIKKIFALTYRDQFFKHLGYEQVTMDTLPEKVYKECVKCHYYNNCNEIAVVKLFF